MIQMLELADKDFKIIIMYIHTRTHTQKKKKRSANWVK